MNEMQSLQSLQPSRLIMRMVLVSALIIIVIGIIFYRSLAALPFALGVMATAGLNVLKLRMLDRTVQKIIQMDNQETGKNIIRLQYLFRYFITGVVLVIIGLIHNFTTAPEWFSSREWYIPVWATIFPNAPEALLNAPFISLYGALFGIFTLQLAVIIVRSLKLEKDGEHFVNYEDDENDENNVENSDNADSDNDYGSSDLNKDNSDDNVNS